MRGNGTATSSPERFASVWFGSGHDTKATCSQSFQLSVKVRATGVRKPRANFFECPEVGSHRPRCPLCSYCDRISALFLPELQNVPGVRCFRPTTNYVRVSSRTTVLTVRPRIRPIVRSKRQFCRPTRTRYLDFVGVWRKNVAAISRAFVYPQ